MAIHDLLIVFFGILLSTFISTIAGLGAALSATGIGGLGILVGLGFYLPFNIVLTYSLGTLLRLFTDWKMGKQWSEQLGIPAAAGLIVGEALVGVGFAITFIVKGMRM